jgi:hypothetical protein
MQQRCVGDQVAQVAELAMSIINGPSVQLGLDLHTRRSAARERAEVK